MRRYNVSCLALTLFILITLLGGCGGSSNKEGQPASLSTVSSVSPTGNIQAAITGITVNSPPVVTFRLFDENGLPLDPTTLTGNVGSIRFMIARLRSSDGNYENFIKDGNGRPGSDASGTFATVGAGLYTYTFATDIADAVQTLNGITFSPTDTQTHTVALEVTRNTASVAGTLFQQVQNVYLNFRPDGQSATQTREIVATSNCNECHGHVGQKTGHPHDGGRRDIALCVLCHNPGLTINGVSFDLKALVHRIHMGKALPGNKAAIAAGGFGLSIDDHRFANIGHPFISADSSTTLSSDGSSPLGNSGTPVECVKCHRAGTDSNGQPFGKDVDRWKNGFAPGSSSATIGNCTTCHDTTVFDTALTVNVADAAQDPVTGLFTPQPRAVTAVPHSAGPRAEGTCSGCHVAAVPGDNAYQFSLTGHHTVFENSSVFTGLNFEILSVTNATAGNRPTVTFRITDDARNVVSPGGTGGGQFGLPAVNNSFNLKLGYFRQADYVNDGMGNFGQPLTQALAAATANGDGTFTITFATAIPAGATGTGVVGLEGTKTYSIPATVKKVARNVRTSGDGIQYYFDLATGAQVTDLAKQRRISVDIDKCNKCHGGSLSLHGGNRKNSVQECVICHNPNATDKNQRPVASPGPPPVAGPVDGLAEQSIHFKVMIHRIHTGEDLDLSRIPRTDTGQRGYVIYGNGRSVHDFGEVMFPRDRRDCLACHVETATFGLPLPAGVLATSTATGTDANNAVTDDNIRGLLPVKSACISCHDTAFAGVHADNHTAPAVGELCVTCHRTGLLLGPDIVHRPIR